MAEIQELATSLGQALGRTSEYQALDRAIKATEGDPDMVELKAEIQKLEGTLQAGIQQGEQPTKEQVEEYEAVVRRFQGLSTYQGVVAAQANFDKIMHTVDEAIQGGMREGASSRIIIPR